jgi:hypothetical protein
LLLHCTIYHFSNLLPKPSLKVYAKQTFDLLNKLENIANTADKIMAAVESPQELSSSPEFDPGKIVRILTEMQGAIGAIGNLDNVRSLVSQNAQKPNTVALAAHLTPSLPGPYDQSTSETVPETQLQEDVNEFEALLRSTEATTDGNDDDDNNNNDNEDDNDKPSAKSRRNVNVDDQEFGRKTRNRGRKSKNTTVAESHGSSNKENKRNKNAAFDEDKIEDDKGEIEETVWTFSQPSGGGIQQRANGKATSRSKKRRMGVFR